jgi:hypothetical protein
MLWSSGFGVEQGRVTAHFNYLLATYQLDCVGGIKTATAEEIASLLII